MADLTQLDELAALLEATGEAHHAAFEETDGGDPEWASWYAAYLQAHLEDRLGRWITRSELTYLLVRAAREHTPDDGPWARAYAELILDEL